MAKSKVTDVDRQVAIRMRQLRIERACSSEELARLIGITYQQYHKYEIAKNRISAGRLHRLAEVLGVGINSFYEGLENQKFQSPLRSNRLLQGFLQNFLKITDPKIRAEVAELTRLLSEEGGHDV